MVRVLLNGRSKLTDEIQVYLRRWRMSVQRLPGVPLDFIQHSRSVCDLIIQTCAECGEEAACSGRQVQSRDMAPVLLVGKRPRACECQLDVWSHLESPGPDGQLLQQAIDACLGCLREASQGGGERQGYHQYAHFLNHELRTPITATSTALEILAQELARHGNERLQGFAHIGLRNVQRLMRTITWSEGYLTSRTRILKPDWRIWHVEELVQKVTYESCAQGELALEYVADAAEHRVISDVNLFGTVLSQVQHALHYSVQGSPLNLQIQVSPEPAASGDNAEPKPGVLELAYRPDPEAGQALSPGDVTRSSLVTQGGLAGQEFLRLVDFTVSRSILDLFRAILLTNATPRPHEPWVTFSMPLQRQLPAVDPESETDLVSVVQE
jgi:hypothetical protein